MNPYFYEVTCYNTVTDIDGISLGSKFSETSAPVIIISDLLMISILKPKWTVWNKSAKMSTGGIAV